MYIYIYIYISGSPVYIYIVSGLSPRTSLRPPGYPHPVPPRYEQEPAHLSLPSGTPVSSPCTLSPV